MVFLLDGQNKLLAERIISEGIPTQSVVYTRKVMEEALRLSASAVVVVHNHPSGEVTPSPLDVIGHDKHDEFIADEVEHILKTDRLRESDAEFLIAVGKLDEAEAYLLKRADQLDGNHYGSLLSLAETMESENRNLAASMIYRSLLLSILERGYTKAYTHGIRYLKKLEKLATIISDWKEFDHHEAFKGRIYQAHGRKHSFWSKYEVKK